MTESPEDKRPKLFVYAPGKNFLTPYFEKFLTEYELTDNVSEADYAVMISDTDIYDVTEGRNFNELSPVRQESAGIAAENEFAASCREHGLAATILRCAPIVCTGMQGMPRRLAEKIYRGTYIGISGNEAVRSFVHAVSLPDAVRASIGKDDIYNVTDCHETTINDFADALAWRMSQKRIFTIKPKWYKLIAGKKKYASESISLTFSAEKLRSASAVFVPVSTIEYLKTHVYDESSL